MSKFLMVVLLASCAYAVDLQQQLNRMASRFHGNVALFAVNMRTGATVAINPDQLVATASVIKLPILVETFAQVKAGKRSLDDKVVLSSEHQVPGSGILGQLRPGL